MEQDGVELSEVMHLPDGRDILMFDRKHMKQSYQDAEEEHQSHLRDVLARRPS